MSHRQEQFIEGMKIFFFRTDPKKLEENGIEWGRREGFKLLFEVHDR